MSASWKAFFLAGWRPPTPAPPPVTNGVVSGGPLAWGRAHWHFAPAVLPPLIRHGATVGITTSTGSTVGTADTNAIRRRIEDELLLVGAL